MTTEIETEELRGIILRNEGEELVVRALPADVARFAPRQPVDVRRNLFRQWTRETEMVETTTFGSATRTYVPATPRDYFRQVGRPAQMVDLAQRWRDLERHRVLYDRSGDPVAEIDSMDMLARMNGVIEVRISAHSIL